MGDTVDYIAILGIAAGILTTFSYLPQLMKVLKTKSARDLSRAWLISSGTGFVLWTIYGGIQSDAPLAIFSAMSLCFVVALLVLKLRYK